MSTGTKREKYRTDGSGRNALRIVQGYFPKVRNVVDAEEDSVIEVTPRDVSTADRRQHRTCAMAVACKRKLDLDGVIISVSTAYTIKGDTATRYKLPESVSREVVSFDRGATFEPGEYRLDAPTEGHKLGTKGGNMARTGKGKHIHRSHFTQGIRTVLGSKGIA